MGAQLSLLTPTASTVALQSYIDIIPNVQYSSTITSSRFLKTIKSLDTNGFIIIKVFIKTDTILKISDILLKLDKQQQLLQNISNTLPFTKIIETERASYVIRPFIKTNLFDRLSTRPFLEKIEKNWILFQLIHSLNKCHQLGIVHGDLKTENVLITSWNWCLITDFENFKPTYLPTNSSQFSFYFDTSKRNTCYLAPERFVDFDDDQMWQQILTPQMDLFAIGCLLAELYLDGSPIFTLSQLFKYKKLEYEPNLNSIDDVSIRDMIKDLIALDPSSRLSLQDILNKYESKIFPSQFYQFVYPFYEEFSNFKISSSSSTRDRFQECDYRIDKIYNEFDIISQNLGYTARTSSSQFTFPIPIVLNLPGLPNYSPKSTANSKLNPMALLFLNMVLASVRNTTHSSFRIKSCDLIIILLEKLHDEAKLDRCLPYLMYLLEDPCCDVKVALLRSITQLLHMCDSISVVNISIWQEYILPKLTIFNNQLNQQTKDSNFLKLQFAIYLPYLMKESLNFYNLTKILQKNNNLLNKLFDKSNLIKEFENFTINLLTDSNAKVKISFLQNITEVCQFFGKDKTNDLILSHLITYLNDKDPYLRVCFIESILPLSMFTGISSLEQYILPLLVQTINDPDELVVFKILQNFNQLCRLGMLKKHYIWDLVKIVIKLVLHPNEWIRKSTLILIISICDTLSLADLYCILYPIIRPFFQYDVTIFTYDSLYPCLLKPLSRSVYNLLINWSQTCNVDQSLFWQKQATTNIDSFGNAGLSFMIKTKNNQRNFNLSDSIVISNNEIPISAEDKLWLLKLQNSGLQDSEFWKLATLRDYIYRISKLNFKKNDSNLQINGNFEIQKIGVLPKTLFFDVIHKSDLEQAAVIKKKSPAPVAESTTTLIANGSPPPPLLPPSSLFNPSQPLLLGKMTKLAPSIHEDKGNAFAIGGNDNVSVLTQHSVAGSTDDDDDDDDSATISKILTVTQHNYKGKNPYILQFLSNFKFEPQLDDYIEFGPQINIETAVSHEQQQWIPKGVLVAHLLEHKSSCNCIAVSPDNNYFVTGDNDGFLKIWDLLRLERNVTGSSSLSVNLNLSIKCIKFLPNRDCLVVALRNGAIKTYRIAFEKNGKNRFNKLNLIREYYLLEDEFSIQLEIVDDLIVMITSKSRIIGIDLKNLNQVFNLQNDLSHGIPISFVIDTTLKKSWIIVSTSNGFLDLWDLRFEIQLKKNFINKKVQLLKLPIGDKLNKPKNRKLVMIYGDDICIFDIAKFNSSKQSLDIDETSINKLEFINHHKNSYILSSTLSNNLLYWNLQKIETNSKLLFSNKMAKFTEFQQNDNWNYHFNSNDEIIKSIAPIDKINDIKFITNPYEMIIVADRSGCINVYR